MVWAQAYHKHAIWKIGLVSIPNNVHKLPKHLLDNNITKSNILTPLLTHILDMQRFWVVYYEISHESLVSSRYTHEPMP